MSKTTLYIPDDLITRLKRVALESSNHKLTFHVVQAIRDYVEKIGKKPKKRFATMLKYKGISRNRKSDFGDPVEYQRKLRSEWDR